MKFLAIAVLSLVASRAADLPLGRIVESVACFADPTQTYALYVPSTYSAAKPAPLLLAFDPRARGLTPVERYQKGAEAFGYIVAGSNNSRNGSWETSMKSVQAMVLDLAARFAIDEKRIYTGGMSGGARVASQVALGSGKIAGVIASSAGLPDGRPRKSVPFPLFGTADDEDFNYIEMKDLDRALTSPHRIVIFQGSHVWLSSELAYDALEWMELQAMKSGLRPRDEAFVNRAFERQMERVPAKNGKDAFDAASAIAADFAGLRDTTKAAAMATELKASKAVKDAIKKDRDDETREKNQLREIYELEAGLRDPDRKAASLVRLRHELEKLRAESNEPEDSSTRRLARRVLRGTTMASSERHPEYRKAVEELGLTNRPRQ